MDLRFTDEQQMLRESARKFIEKECGSERVRALMDAETTHDPALWAKIAEQGWTAIHVPEAHGGLGLPFLDVAVVLEEMGRGPLPGPYFSSAVLGTYAVSLGTNEALHGDLLPGVATGETILALATDEPRGAKPTRADREGDHVVVTGEKCYVVEASAASVIVVSAKDGDETLLLAIDAGAAGIDVTPLRSMDRTRRQHAVALRAVRVPASRVIATGKEADDVLAAVRLRGAAGLCAEMVGGMEWVLHTTLDYAKTRHQFGVPIGTFQAIKHPMANVFVALEGARSLALYAAWTVDRAPEEARAAVAMAKSYTNEAYVQAAAAGIQAHGGIGFTWEHDLHLFFKRAKCSALQMGTTTEQREALARAIGL